MKAPTLMSPQRVAKMFFGIIDSYPPVVEFVRQIFHQFAADLIVRETVLALNRYVKLEIPIVCVAYIGKTDKKFWLTERKNMWLKHVSPKT